MTEGLTQSGGNVWKLTTIGLALVGATALITGVVVASRSKSDTGSANVETPLQRSRAETSQRTTTAAAPVTRTQTPTVARGTETQVPSQAIVRACNEQAAATAGSRDKTTEVVKDGAVGAVLGAAVGAAGGAIADGGKGAGKGAAIGGLLGAGAGTLYGVNDNRKHDAAYRDAYANCMRARGYSG
jgi:hypothetical protein